MYLSRGGRLERLSCDHVAPGAGYRHVLARAVGLAPEIEPHLFEVELKDGDVACLCSDGVYNLLNEDALASKLSARAAARALVFEAREHATPETGDDLSAIVLAVNKTGRGPAGSPHRWKSPALCAKARLWMVLP